MRRAAGFLGAISALLLVVSFGATSPAEASHVTAGTGGNYLWCNVRVENLTAGDSSVAHWFACTSVTGSGLSASGPRKIYWQQQNGATLDPQPMTCGTSTTLEANGVNWKCTGSHAWNAAPYSPGGTGPTRVIEIPRTAGSSDYCDSTVPAGWTSTPAAACPGGFHKATVDVTSVGSGYPAYPPVGGTPPPPAQAAVKCWVDLDAGEGIWRARFGTTVTNPLEGVTDSYGWTFGDSATSTLEDPQHVYATATNAGAKWSAVVTVHRVDGYGQSPTDKTCTVVFDFTGESHVDGDQGEGDEPGEEDEGNCASNPAPWNIVGWLKRLFIPCGDVIAEKADELVTAAGDNWPIGAIQYAAGGVEDLSEDATTGYAADSGYAEGQHVEGVECSHLSVPLKWDSTDDGDISTQQQADLQLFDNCMPGPNDEQRDPWKVQLRNVTRGLSVVFAMVIGLAVIRNAAQRAMNKGGDS
jgi:hypothetical protein